MAPLDCEGDLYAKSECDHVGKIKQCEEVLISGRKDATDSLIRQGLDDSTGLGKDRSILHLTCTDVDDIEEVIARESGPPFHEFGRGCFYRHMGG